MKTVGSYEAKTHLPHLLKEVAQGEKITITKHGMAIALLIPVSLKQKKPSQEIIQELRTFRKRNFLKGLSISEMIKKGRKY